MKVKVVLKNEKGMVELDCIIEEDDNKKLNVFFHKTNMMYYDLIVSTYHKYNLYSFDLKEPDLLSMLEWLKHMGVDLSYKVIV